MYVHEKGGGARLINNFLIIFIFEITKNKWKYIKQKKTAPVQYGVCLCVCFRAYQLCGCYYIKNVNTFYLKMFMNLF